MILLIILAVTVIVLIVLAGYLLVHMDGIGAVVGFLVAALLAFFCLLGTGMRVFFDIPEKIYVFKAQKVFIEEYDANMLEKAGVIQTKSDLNNWLFEAQYSKNRFGIFSAYPDEVLRMEPIR